MRFAFVPDNHEDYGGELSLVRRKYPLRDREIIATFDAKSLCNG